MANFPQIIGSYKQINISAILLYCMSPEHCTHLFLQYSPLDAVPSCCVMLQIFTLLRHDLASQLTISTPKNVNELNYSPFHTCALHQTMSEMSGDIFFLILQRVHV